MCRHWNMIFTKLDNNGASRWWISGEKNSELRWFVPAGGPLPLRIRTRWYWLPQRHYTWWMTCWLLPGIQIKELCYYDLTSPTQITFHAVCRGNHGIANFWVNLASSSIVSVQCRSRVSPMHPRRRCYVPLVNILLTDMSSSIYAQVKWPNSSLRVVEHMTLGTWDLLGVGPRNNTCVELGNKKDLLAWSHYVPYESGRQRNLRIQTSCSSAQTLTQAGSVFRL